MDILDTNLFVNHFNQKCIISSPFYFTDLNLCEWLRGKSLDDEEKEFYKIDGLINKTNSSYRFNNSLQNYENKLNNRQFHKKYRFKIAHKVSKKIFKQLLSYYFAITYLYLNILYLSKNRSDVEGGKLHLNNKNDEETWTINYVLSRVFNHTNSCFLTSIANEYFVKSKKEVNEAGIYIYNEIMKSINNHVAFSRCKPIVSHKFSNSELFKSNRVNISESELKEYIDSFLNFYKNDSQTKNLIFKVLKNSLNKDGFFEFNDIADFMYDWIAKNIRCAFITNDDTFINKNKNT